VETAAPLTRVRGSAVEEAALRWKSLLDSAPSPRIALLVGGDSPRHALTAEFARRLAHDVMEMAARAGGSVFATTSRRTTPEVRAVLAEALEGTHHVHLWQPGQSGDENPYLGYLALADALVVTGESASMLAEACATRKPVYIYPLPERRRSLKIALVDAVTEAVTWRAYARPRNRRGTTRPQKRLERLCSILLARGIVRPPPDIGRLHRALIERGAARPFGERIEAPGGCYDETAAVAARVRELVGYPR
jgi:mitochondrial fission protein ELM1